MSDSVTPDRVLVCIPTYNERENLPVVVGRIRAAVPSADILVLASSREGWANVLLESMACGTPVVATPIWGTPEVVAAPAAGRLAAGRTSDALAQAVAELQHALPNRVDVRAYAEQFSWAETTRGQLELFERIARDPAGRRRAREIGAAGA